MLLHRLNNALQPDGVWEGRDQVGKNEFVHGVNSTMEGK